jgi:hypothetical protein
MERTRRLRNILRGSLGTSSQHNAPSCLVSWTESEGGVNLRGHPSKPKSKSILTLRMMCYPSLCLYLLSFNLLFQGDIPFGVGSYVKSNLSKTNLGTQRNRTCVGYDLLGCNVAYIPQNVTDYNTRIFKLTRPLSWWISFEYLSFNGRIHLEPFQGQHNGINLICWYSFLNCCYNEL